MQQPLLYLGLMGFEAEEEARVRHWLQTQEQPLKDASPAWQIVDFQDADALLICGHGVQQADRFSLQFKSALDKQGSALGLQLDELKLPYAISHVQELRALGLEVGSGHEFDPRQDHSLLSTIQHFELTLRPLRSLYALALELTQRTNDMDGNHTYHLQRSGGLDAIVDAPGRRVLLRSGVRPEDIGDDVWHRRPRSANFAPAHFVECSLEEMTWLFALHCQKLDLPERYTRKPIHLRRNPRVRGTLLLPRHAILLDRLSRSSATLAQLRQDLAAQAHWLERDLFALYLTRAISTAVPALDDMPGGSIPHNGLDTTGKWMLDRLSRRTNTVIADLKPSF